MSLMTLLEQAQGGNLYAAVARSLDLDEAQTRNAMRKLCPAIAERLQARAAADDELFQTLLDMIDNGAQASPLDDPDSLTNAEAVADGNAILDDVYGSRNDAMVALRQADETIPERELRKLAPLSATAVVAALAQSNRPLGLSAAASPAAGSGSGGGFFAALVSAIIAGVVSALTKQLKGRSRRRTTGYARTRSRRKTASRTSPATRRRKASTSASVEEVFREMISKLGK